jgi:hypothetical protein
MSDCYIPLKDKLLVELIRSAICWVIWLERNNILFRGVVVSSIRSLGFMHNTFNHLLVYS